MSSKVLEIISRQLDELDGFKTIQCRYQNLSDKTIKRIICSWDVYNIINERVNTFQKESIGFINPDCCLEKICDNFKRS